MALVTVVYWRDIPAQVIAGKGRRATKIQLSERFEQAIDRAAMRSDAHATDAYLAHWRKADPFEFAGSDSEAAQAVAARLEAEHDLPRLRALIENGGNAPREEPSNAQSAVAGGTGPCIVTQFSKDPT